MLHPDNPMRRGLQSVLIFEVIVFGLTIPAMIQVEQIAWQQAFTIGLLGAAFAIAGVALMRRSAAGFVCGWITQVIAVGMGFAVGMMFFVGGAFALIWVMSMVLGKRMDAASDAPPDD